MLKLHFMSEDLTKSLLLYLLKTQMNPKEKHNSNQELQDEDLILKFNLRLIVFTISDSLPSTHTPGLKLLSLQS